MCRKCKVQKKSASKKYIFKFLKGDWIEDRWFFVFDKEIAI